MDAAAAGKAGEWASPANRHGARLARRGVGRAALLLAAALALDTGARGPRATAAEAVFTVGNYPVEARADNAVAAKTKALADGQQAAFRSLLKRLVPVTAYQRLRQLPPVKAGDLVEGVKVRSERNSSTDYIASLDFSFQSKAVRDLLRREGIPFIGRAGASGHPRSALARRRRPAAPKDEAAWTNVWKGLDLEHALTPVKLQTLKKEIAPDAVNALAEGDGSAIRTLVAAYGSELRAAGRRRAGYRGQAAQRHAHGARRGRRLHAAAGLSPRPGRSRLYQRAGGRGLAGHHRGALEGHQVSRRRRRRWRHRRPAGDSELLIAVQFRGMSEWQDISRKLSATPGIEELEVAGLSARGARVTLRYAEGAERLADALAQQGLSLRNTGGNWVLGLQ